MLMTIHMLVVGSVAKMVQSCIAHDLCQRAPVGLAFANGMDVCVVTASIVRLSQTDVVNIGST